MALPAVIRDFRQGIFTPYSVNDALVPQNSVSRAVNIDFDTVLGNATVRKGTSPLIPQVVSSGNCLGLREFVTSGNTKNLLVAIFSGIANATLYYYDSTWHASTLTTLNNTAKVRMAQFGNELFEVNGSEPMKATADGNVFTTTNCMTTRVPNMVVVSQQRLLTAGDASYRDRVWFSSIIDPSTSPFITWNENATSGDFIDINPDDGSNVTALVDIGGATIVHKGKGIYKLDSIYKTVTPLTIFAAGATQQEAVVVNPTDGQQYFFTGQAIYRMTTGYPEQISRLGVQDWIDAINPGNWQVVVAGTDAFNVYFFIGDVTLNQNQDNEQSFTNVCLKFSVRDSSWTVRSYGQTHQRYANYTINAISRFMVEGDAQGFVQLVDRNNFGVGMDNETPIFYELETQDLDFGDKATTKSITQNIAAFVKSGQDGVVSIRVDEGDFVPVISDLSNHINWSGNVNLQGHQFTLRWAGTSSGSMQPMLEGFEIPFVNDLGYKRP